MNLNEEIKNLLQNKLIPFGTTDSLSHRGIGDMIEHFCTEIVSNKFQEKCIKSKSKKSIDDFTINMDNSINLFDIKSHQINESKFSMPNLISVKRLMKLLDDDKKTLNYIFVDYNRISREINISNVKIIPVWEIDWSCLSIGALGLGQVQISNKKNPIITTTIGKNEWKNHLKKEAIDFYQNQIVKYEKQLKIWSF